MRLSVLCRRLLFWNRTLSKSVENLLIVNKGGIPVFLSIIAAKSDEAALHFLTSPTIVQHRILTPHKLWRMLCEQSLDFLKNLRWLGNFTSVPGGFDTLTNWKT